MISVPSQVRDISEAEAEEELELWLWERFQHPSVRIMSRFSRMQFLGKVACSNCLLLQHHVNTFANSVKRKSDDQGLSVPVRQTEEERWENVSFFEGDGWREHRTT
jgi:hypothetical protein